MWSEHYVYPCYSFPSHSRYRPLEFLTREMEVLEAKLYGKILLNMRRRDEADSFCDGHLGLSILAHNGLRVTFSLSLSLRPNNRAKPGRFLQLSSNFGPSTRTQLLRGRPYPSQPFFSSTPRLDLLRDVRPSGPVCSACCMNGHALGGPSCSPRNRSSHSVGRLHRLF